MENNKLLLTKQEAMELLPFGRRGFESLIRTGELGFKKVNGRLYFSKADLERWVNDLEHRTEYTPEVKPTGHISRCKPQTEKKYSLDALVAQQALEKLSSSATRKLQSYKQKISVKPQVSFQA